MGLEQGPWQNSQKGERRKEKPQHKLERVWFDAQSGNPHTEVLVHVCYVYVHVRVGAVCLCVCCCAGVA